MHFPVYFAMIIKKDRRYKIYAYVIYRISTLLTWVKQSGLELKKFFNTSGNLYKELKLKDRLKDMSEEEQLHLLSRNGMLIKRPLLICEKGVAVGFKEDNYKNLCSE